MNLAASLLVLLSTVAAGDTLSGTVVNDKDQPVPNARVFAEPGLAGALVETHTDANGAWRFEGLSADSIGIFAVADGYAFGGLTSSAATAGDRTIRLAPLASLECKIVDPKKHPVAGAQITRVGLLGAGKVGIPLSKLKAFGFDFPASDDAGHIALALMPKGGRVAIKVGHPSFAQEALDDVPVGDSAVTVTLWPGVLMEGDVLMRDGHAPVAGVPVIVRNAQPPYDSAVVMSSDSGRFSIRLKFGVYMYQAVSNKFRSAAWERLTLTGETTPSRMAVYVSTPGEVHGKVCDAVTGSPVQGAKIAMDAAGSPAAVTRTGSSGEFTLPAAAGECTVRLDSAPGYGPPEQPALNLQVTEGKTTQLPTFWLTPIPSYTIQIVDASMAPVPNVVVTIVRPEQFGWRLTDDEGKVTVQFASLPPDGTVVGLAEQADAPNGAMFSLKRGQTGVAKVQLFPLGVVKGTAMTPAGKPAEGVVLAGLFGEEGIPLWRTVVGKDGSFSWKGVVPQVPQSCLVTQGDQFLSEASALLLERSETKDLGKVALTAEPLPRTSTCGKPLEWFEAKVLSGQLPDKAKCKATPAVVLYCSANDAAMGIEGMAAASKLWASKGVLFVVVVDGAFTGASPGIPVLSGKAPGVGTTYLVDKTGMVRLETFGLPPQCALLDLVR